MDLLLDREVGDLIFINKACPVTSDEGDVVVQRLYIKLRTFFEEWFLNTAYGIPYMAILGSKMSQSTIDNILQAQVLDTEGVAEIKNWSSNLNGGSRIYDCTFHVRTINGVVTSPLTISPPL